jgi:Mce-associated membrane protein
MPEDLERTAEDETPQEESEAAEVDRASNDEPETTGDRRPIAWSRVLAYGVLPGVALLLALTAGYFKWVVQSADDLALARIESVRVASEDAVALLSYKADSADKDLGAARERLTGDFKDAYTTLTREVVIPGAKEKHISAVAKVNAAASVSATANHALVLLFVNQTVTIGEGAPTDTQPVIRVTLDKVEGRWLVSHFDPV